MNYWLMNKNKAVLLFSYDKETHTILKILETVNAEYAPLGIVEYKTGISRRLLNSWWHHRSIPASRNNFREAMDTIGVESSVELLEKCYGLSLSDQYWVKPEKSSLHWENVNFFQNDFSEDVGRVLLGQEAQFSNQTSLRSPDNSSDGNLKKKWKIINGKRCLIKSGNSFNNQEPFNELIATALYRRLLDSDEYVPYVLIKENDTYYSCCETMVNTNEELIPALYVDRQEKLKGSDSLYEHYIQVCEHLGLSRAREKINKMIVCDFILANFDRHYRNFGVIRNVETLKMERIAPIFDSGSSLYATTPTLKIGAEYTSKPFKSVPKEQLDLVKDLSWFSAEKLEGFIDEVKSILLMNPYISQDRIESIARCVQKNIDYVVHLQKERNKLEIAWKARNEEDMNLV